MNINECFTALTSKRCVTSEKVTVVNLFREFIGDDDFFKCVKKKEQAYGFWGKKVGRCGYGEAMAILKDLETLPLKYNKAGTIINKLKKLNGTRTK